MIAEIDEFSVCDEMLSDGTINDTREQATQHYAMHWLVFSV